MKAFFEPASVVLIGVSRQTGVGAYNNLEMLLRYGYQGKIFLVHPQAPEILGYQAYARVADLPEVPELAVISLARDRVVPVVEECLARGIRRFVVISQGFADADPPGRDLQARLVSLIRSHQALLVGPNTMGSLNAFADFTSAFVDVKREPHPPPVSLAAQSGALQVGQESFTGPLGKAVDLGNAADVGFTEVLEYFEHDPQTRVIVLHMEGLVQGRRFLEVAHRVNRQKPILVLKTGSSTAGAQAALSHTGSLVGQDAVVSAAFARAGITRARGASDLVDKVQAFRKLPVLKGPRIGIATPSGALGIMTLDALSREGLMAGHLPAEIREKVEPQGPYWHRLHNPVDLWPIGMQTGDYLEVAGETLRAFLADPGIDGLLAMLPALSSPLHRNITNAPEFIAGLDLDKFDKPLVVALYGDYRDHLMNELEQVPGVACFCSVERAVQALACLYQYHQARSSLPARLRLAAESQAHSSPARPEKPVLLGQEALDFLEGHHIPIATGALAHSPEEAVAAAQKCTYPVVLKIVAQELLHKWERGGVLLNVGSDAEVLEGFRILQARVEGEQPWGILVQKQLEGKEVLLGVKQDPTFGPVVVCGWGGIYTEALQDVAQTLAPIDETQARELLATLRVYPLLQGVRGEAPVALPELARALAALSRLAVAEPALKEVDLNPVVVNQRGCWAVDARLVWGD
jgi:acetate---CoA ligase (ADP-forming)